jgi:hypothetical protein
VTRQTLLSSVVLCGLLASPCFRADDAKPVLAGWFGVFPEFPIYQRTFEAPTVGKGKAPTAYKQTAKYEWTGGALRSLTITLARDPAFKKDHTAEALRQAKPTPKEVTIAKKTGWLTSADKEGVDRSLKLVVPLDEDKALILEAKGLVTEEDLTAMAGKFDLAAVEKALGQPPRTDFNRSLEAFKALKKGIPLSEVSAWVGDGDADVGRGIHVLAYKLSDGSRVLLGFADVKNLLYVKHEKDGQTVDLVK